MTNGTSDIIAIIGFMGSGKSTIGVRLASRLHMDFVDLDEAISKDSGKSIKEIFTAEGRKPFESESRRP